MKGTIIRNLMNKKRKAGESLRILGRKVSIAFVILCLLLSGEQPAYAFGGGIETLNNSLMDVIALAGVGLVIWGGWEMAKAMGERDSAGKVHALEIIIGGLIAIGIRTFVGMFGA